MKSEDVERVFCAIRNVSGLDEFVVIGSLSALGLAGDQLPPRMTRSMKVVAYPERDPNRAPEFFREFGEGSSFHLENGYYFDAVSPDLPTLPEGWEDRLLQRSFPSGIKVKFLEPNDCAISKYARSEMKDREWIRAGIEAGILSLPTIEYRMRETLFLDDDERRKADASFAEDQRWFQALRGLT
jgi:hypothetical protein